MVWNPLNQVIFPMDRNHGSQVMTLACEHRSAFIHEPVTFLGRNGSAWAEKRGMNHPFLCQIVNRLTANDTTVLEASGMLFPIVASRVNDLMLSRLILAVQLLVRGVSPSQHHDGVPHCVL